MLPSPPDLGLDREELGLHDGDEVENGQVHGLTGRAAAATRPGAGRSDWASSPCRRVVVGERGQPLDVAVPLVACWGPVVISHLGIGNEGSRMHLAARWAPPWGELRYGPSYWTQPGSAGCRWNLRNARIASESGLLTAKSPYRSSNIGQSPSSRPRRRE
jgi:hypothetical protein